jgi:hypothetical protein
MLRIKGDDHIASRVLDQFGYFISKERVDNTVLFGSCIDFRIWKIRDNGYNAGRPRVSGARNRK